MCVQTRILFTVSFNYITFCKFLSQTFNVLPGQHPTYLALMICSVEPQILLNAISRDIFSCSSSIGTYNTFRSCRQNVSSITVFRENRICIDHVYMSGNNILTKNLTRNRVVLMAYQMFEICQTPCYGINITYNIAPLYYNKTHNFKNFHLQLFPFHMYWFTDYSIFPIKTRITFQRYVMT